MGNPVTEASKYLNENSFYGFSNNKKTVYIKFDNKTSLNTVLAIAESVIGKDFAYEQCSGIFFFPDIVVLNNVQQPDIIN